MYNHYKDLEPEETVKNIKSIFQKLDIEVEENWLNSLDNIYSLQLRVIDTPLFSNGKGISESLARASAYAELIERMQNGIIFRLLDNYELIIEKAKNKNIEFNIIETETALNYIDRYLNLFEGIDEKKREVLLELFSTALKRFRFQEPIIYKNLNGDEICLPSLFCDLYYGSNGLAAGNTKYEAIIQALCEVMERYVVKKVIQHELKQCSDITSYVKESMKVFNNQINEIEKTGLIIKFLDMSIETQLPVVMSVLIDPKSRKYFINCASHPSLMVAIERSITETFQGRPIDEISYFMTPIVASYENRIQDNLNSIFTNGEGIFPINLLNFESMPNYLGGVWKDFESVNTNKQMAEIIIKKIQEQGFLVYVGDFSVCGFPTYQVIVPGMSEINDIIDTSQLKKLNYTQKVKSILSKKNPSEVEINELINYFMNYEYPKDYILRDFYNLPLTGNANTSLDALHLNLLLSMAYGYIGDYNNAKINIQKYNEILSTICDNKDIIEYYLVVENVFHLLSQGGKKEDIMKILGNFFTKSIIEEVLTDISKEKILNYLPKIKCSGEDCCSDCEVNDICSVKVVANIVEKIKEQTNIKYAL